MVKEERKERDLAQRFSEDRDAIETFLRAIENAKGKGEWRDARYNVFDVLGRPRLEEAHSRFVAWLLDPNAAHGLHDSFLRQFMAKAVGKEPPTTLDVTVVPEKSFVSSGIRRFDIHVTGDRWCMVVENKIDDQPWPDQRERLKEFCRQQSARGKKTWLVYLTRNARSIKQRTHSISYREVGEILDTMRPDVAADLIINHFRDHILSDLEPDHAR